MLLCTILSQKSQEFQNTLCIIQVDTTLWAHVFSNKQLCDRSVTSEASSILALRVRATFSSENDIKILLRRNTVHCDIPLAFYCSRHGETVLFKWPFVETTPRRRAVETVGTVSLFVFGRRCIFFFVE